MWRWQTIGTLVSDDLAPKVRGVATWINFSDTDFFQEFNRNFAARLRPVPSRARASSRGAPIPWTVNLRLSREQVLGYGSSTITMERLPTVEANLRPTPFFGQAVFVEASAQGGVLGIDRGEGLPSGTYVRFDLFPKVNVPLSLFP